MTRKKRDHGPCIVICKSIKFFLHCFNPLKIVSGLLIRIMHIFAMISTEVKLNDIPIEMVSRIRRGRRDCALVKQQGMVDLVFSKMSWGFGKLSRVMKGRRGEGRGGGTDVVMKFL